MWSVVRHARRQEEQIKVTHSARHQPGGTPWREPQPWALLTKKGLVSTRLTVICHSCRCDMGPVHTHCGRHRTRRGRAVGSGQPFCMMWYVECVEGGVLGVGGGMEVGCVVLGMKNLPSQQKQRRRRRRIADGRRKKKNRK